MNLKQHLILLKDKRDLFRQPEVISTGNISYANWWKDDPNKIWFTKAIRSWFNDNTTTPIRFYSVFGPRKKTDEKYNGIKVFYTGENVEPRVRYNCLNERVEKAAGWESRMEAYRDYAISSMDLSIGFGFHQMDKYLRLPFWVLRYFEPTDTVSDIQNRLDKIEMQAGTNASSSIRKGAAIIASHDFFGTRANIADTLSDVISIEYGGKWRNSSDDLWNKCNNDKGKYLTNFRFNICPENMDAPGYVTEKIFDAYSSGTIPIYHGDLGHPEISILNPESYISWNYDDDNEDNINTIIKLEQDNDFYREFLKQNKFKNGAAEYIFDTYIEPLHNAFDLLLKQ